MIIASISDPHTSTTYNLGARPWQGSLNSRARSCLSTLSEALSLAVEQCADVFVMTGDLCDNSSPNPNLLAKLRQLFERASAAGMHIILAVGNHDWTTDAPGDHALSPLFGPNITIVEKHQYFPEYELIVCGYHHEGPKDYLPSILAQYTGATRLSLHCGLSTDKTPHWLADKNGGIKARTLQKMCTDHGITHVYMGDWHAPDKWCPKKADFQAYQIGTLIPHSFSDSYTKVGCVCIDNDGEVSMHAVPGPRFANLDATKGQLIPKSMRDTLASGTDLFIRVKCVREDFEAIEKEILDILNECAPSRAALNLVGNFVPPKATQEKDESTLRAVSDEGNLQAATSEWLTDSDNADEVKQMAQAELSRIMKGRGSV